MQAAILSRDHEERPCGLRFSDIYEQKHRVVAPGCVSFVGGALARGRPPSRPSLRGLSPAGLSERSSDLGNLA